MLGQLLKAAPGLFDPAFTEPLVRFVECISPGREHLRSQGCCFFARRNVDVFQLLENRRVIVQQDAVSPRDALAEEPGAEIGCDATVGVAGVATRGGVDVCGEDAFRVASTETAAEPSTRPPATSAAIESET